MWLGNEASMSCSKIVSHFSGHYASLAHESDELAKQRTECQRHFQKAMETAEDDNTKVMDVEWREGGRGRGRGGCKVTLIKNVPSSSLFLHVSLCPRSTQLLQSWHQQWKTFVPSTEEKGQPPPHPPSSSQCPRKHTMQQRIATWQNSLLSPENSSSKWVKYNTACHWAINLANAWTSTNKVVTTQLAPAQTERRLSVWDSFTG